MVPRNRQNLFFQVQFSLKALQTLSSRQDMQECCFHPDFLSQYAEYPDKLYEAIMTVQGIKRIDIN